MKIAYISTYSPRTCGLATFNHNLVKAIDSQIFEAPAKGNTVIAVDNTEGTENLSYPDEVKYIIRQQVQEDYTSAATFINQCDADACILQHEFGIYGGESGLYVLSLLHQIQKPIVSILHTVLDSPKFLQKIIVREIAKKSSKVVVMSKKAIDLLTRIYRIDPTKIQIIPHGVPDFETPEINPVHEIPLLKGKRILLTFGLINRNKGIETVIKALPKTIADHPDVIYVILGKTHPGVLHSSGEEYREYLIALVQELGVENHVLFLDRFVDEQELFEFLSASTIYVTPYFNEAQITSGTLAYAVGAGAAVVSTPYWHAQELLNKGRGKLFNFKDIEGLTGILKELLTNPEKLQTMKSRAYRYGLTFRWPIIGRNFLTLMEKVASHPDYSEQVLRQIVDPGLMPVFSLEYAMRLTDDTGIFQHAKYGIPNRKEGYCLDDNSRALIMSLLAYRQAGEMKALDLMPVYLSFIHDMQLEDGDFRNFLSYGRQFLDDRGTDDSFGRTIWSLGYLIYCSPNQSYVELGTDLLFKALPHFKKLMHLRGICTTIIGLSYYLKSNPNDGGMLVEMNRLTDQLLNAYHNSMDDNWKWFEDHLTYDNAMFPLALLHSSEITENADVRTIGVESLHFLENLTLRTGFAIPVGNDGWYFRGHDSIPVYDQQAIEIMALVLMYFQAYKLSGEDRHLQHMFTCYLWFLGENSLRVPVYDPETTGCSDGLTRGGVNRNQGAESTLAYLISHLTVLEALSYDRSLVFGPRKLRKVVNSG